MSLNPVTGGNLYRPNIGRTGRKEKPVQPPKHTSKASDRCVLSAAPEMERNSLLETIKKRVQSGYYQSGEVIEELSDTFARAFDQRI